MKMFRAIKFTVKTIWKAAKPTFLVCLVAQIFIALSSVVNTITFKEIIDSANNQKTLLGLSIFGVIIFRLGYELIRKIIEGSIAKDNLLQRILNIILNMLRYYT